ncbi:MAG: thymidylate kinase, partial [Pseudomonadota bacterium]
MIRVRSGSLPIIDMDPEVALARGLARRSGEDRFEDMGADFQMRLAQGFRELAAAQPGRCRLIDGTGTPEEVSGRVLAEIALRLP